MLTFLLIFLANTTITRPFPHVLRKGVRKHDSFILYQTKILSKDQGVAFILYKTKNLFKDQGLARDIKVSLNH